MHCCRRERHEGSTRRMKKEAGEEEYRRNWSGLRSRAGCNHSPTLVQTEAGGWDFGNWLTPGVTCRGLWLWRPEDWIGAWIGA